MYNPPAHPLMISPMNSFTDQQADLLRLLSMMGLVGIFMVLVVYIGYYALLYRRQDNARRRRMTDRAKQEFRSEEYDVDRTECRCLYNHNKNHNSDWSMVSSSRCSSGTDYESSTEVELCNDYEPAVTNRILEWPSSQQLKVQANHMARISWSSHYYP